MPVTTQRIGELLAMANGLYGTIVGLTNEPAEAASLIQMLHLRLWMNCADGAIDVDEMLRIYTAEFKDNLALNEQIEHQRMQ